MIEPSDLITTNSKTLIIGIALIIQNIRYISRNSFFVFIYFLPHTFMHELTHYIFSLITNGKPIKFSVIPKKTTSGYDLGYVSSSNMRWYNASFISLAPLSLLLAAYYFEQSYSVLFSEYSYLNVFIYYYILISLITASAPSPIDIKISLDNLFGFIWFLIIIGIVFYIFKVYLI